MYTLAYQVGTYALYAGMLHNILFVYIHKQYVTRDLFTTK